MPGWFNWAIFFFIVASIVAVVATLFVPRGYEDHNARKTYRPRKIGYMIAAAIAAVAVLFTAVSSWNIVGTRNVGIVTNFGRPAGECGAGPCVVWPWQQVHEMDGAIQLQSFEGKDFDHPESAIKVRLGNNSAAYVEANLNWRLKPDAAPQMFQNFRTFQNIRENLVDKQLQVMLSHRFANFNPQAQQQGADLPGIADQVRADLQAAVGSEIEIQTVRVPGIFYDSGTQGRIDDFNRKAQETKNAEQQVKTAQQERLAAEERARQAPPDLRIAIFNCIQKASENNRDASGCWGQIGGQPLIQVPKS